MMKITRQFINGYFQVAWASNDKNQEILSFASGKAAMMLAFSWSYSPIAEQVSESRNFPEGLGGFPTPYFGSDTLAFAVTKGWITQAEADAAAPYVTTKLSAGTAYQSLPVFLG